MTQPDFHGAARHAVKQLEQNLALIYTYHSLTHTCDEVVGMTERFARLEGITGEERILLLTGAYYHDIGFIQTWDNHEYLGVQYIHQVLPEFGYTLDHIKVVEGIILATRLPQMPHTLLEEIVADADLDALGREDFWNRNLALRYEMGMLGFYFSDEEWCKRQMSFLLQHHYFTVSAKRIRDEHKKKNITFLLERCKASCSEVNWSQIIEPNYAR